ncbi:DNA mismatch endonuclease Vsr [Sphingomonas sp. H160509]|uniref:very short patch repair endonuclease n=1 Tax=Sphingomonas sp. H160509 TaxID=2955313 RepID=UPI002097610B|nr:DNA mismatch endonuclease Vsr [Sphingomonas sp. H160509]MDD1449790.1 DNA mismatch endonuclease Vsr [Sphingomonas sp. H160509]
MDILSPADRSERMRRVRSKDTKPELVVRRLVHGMGLRYRLHRKDLPGTPDIVFGPRRRVILVHGCFWHGHDDANCRKGALPKTRIEFWRNKIDQNRLRDERTSLALDRAGWGQLVVWECECRDREILSARLRAFLIP